jgi:type II secretory pathway component PulC
MNTVKNIALTLLALMPLTSWSAATGKLEDLSVMALGAVDGRAVVKTADGKMQVVKVGDTIPGTQAVVSQVLNDKLIVEDTVVGLDKQSRKQTAWISKASQAGEKSAVQRIETEAPAKTPSQPVQVMKKMDDPKAPKADASKSAQPKKK